MSQLTDLLELVKSCRNHKWFPLSYNVKYWKVGKKIHIRRNYYGNDYTLNFKMHSLTKLKDLASWVGVSADTKDEIIQLLEAKMITRSKFIKEIREAIEERKSIKEKEKEKEAEKSNDEKERAVCDQLKEYRRTGYVNLESFYNSTAWYSNQREAYEKEIENELEISPILYKFLMEKEAEISNLKELISEMCAVARKCSNIN